MYHYNIYIYINNKIHRRIPLNIKKTKFMRFFQNPHNEGTLTVNGRSIYQFSKFTCLGIVVDSMNNYAT